MPTVTDQAIVIRQWDFSETSQTVSLFTREHGIIRGLAKGARREKGSFSGGLDVLTGGQIVAIVKPGRELATLTAWHVQQMYPAVRRTLAANRVGLYMADLVHHMIIDHDPHPIVFDSLANALENISSEHDRELSLLRFQWSLLKEAGYEPQVQADARTGAALPPNAPWLKFSAADGGLIVTSEPASGESPGNDAETADNDDDRSTIATSASNARESTKTSSDRDAISHRSWKVRKDTIEALRAISGGRTPTATPKPESISRANRLLAAYFREIIGSEPPAMRWAFSTQVEASPPSV